MSNGIIRVDAFSISYYQIRNREMNLLASRVRSLFPEIRRKVANRSNIEKDIAFRRTIAMLKECKRIAQKECKHIVQECLQRPGGEPQMCVIAPWDRDPHYWDQWCLAHSLKGTAERFIPEAQCARQKLPWTARIIGAIVYPILRLFTPSDSLVQEATSAMRARGGYRMPARFGR